MLWPWKAKPVRVTDIEQAQLMREEAREEIREAVTTGYVVDQVTGYLAERRALNHFGDDLSISFKRKPGHA